MYSSGEYPAVEEYVSSSIYIPRTKTKTRLSTMEGRKDVSPYSHVDKEIVRLQENKNLENTKKHSEPLMPQLPFTNRQSENRQYYARHFLEKFVCFDITYHL